MILAQRLYEAGHITYMRTDSTFLSQDALNLVREYITDHFGDDYLPQKPNFYGNKQNAQEAHEAIRPSHVLVKSSQLTGMERDAQRLYELIWRQFVACQMMPARYQSVNLMVAAGDIELKAKGRTLVFEGYTKVQPPAKTDDILLPAVKVGEKLPLIEILPTQHFTSPPARYSEASLVKELESLGIGRPSTYASIISTIQERGYVKLENKRLYAEKMGDIVTERLVESFPDLMDYAFTMISNTSLIMPRPPMACVLIIQPMCLIFTVIYVIAQCRYAQVQRVYFWVVQVIIYHPKNAVKVPKI